MQHKAIPFLGVSPFFAYPAQLFLRVVDQGTQAGAFPRGQHLFKCHVHLLPDNTGRIVQDVEKSLVLSVQITHKMLGPLGQVQDGLQIDDLCADLLPCWIFFRQQAQKFHAIPGNVHLVHTSIDYTEPASSFLLCFIFNRNKETGGKAALQTLLPVSLLSFICRSSFYTFCRFRMDMGHFFRPFCPDGG